MTKLDIGSVPWSRRESWMSIALLEGARAPSGGDGVYLRTHHGGNNALFRLLPISDGASWVIDAEPHLLRLSARRSGFVELCFDGPDTVRIRGTGLGLELCAEPWSVVYSESVDLITFNMRPVLRRYQVERLCGGAETAGVQGKTHQSIKFSPDRTGRWEAAIDEFWSTWVKRKRAPFDECAASSEGDFTAFLPVWSVKRL